MTVLESNNPFQAPPPFDHDHTSTRHTAPAKVPLLARIVSAVFLTFGLIASFLAVVSLVDMRAAPVGPPSVHATTLTYAVAAVVCFTFAYRLQR